MKNKDFIKILEDLRNYDWESIDEEGFFYHQEFLQEIDKKISLIRNNSQELPKKRRTNLNRANPSPDASNSEIKKNKGK